MSTYGIDNGSLSVYNSKGELVMQNELFSYYPSGIGYTNGAKTYDTPIKTIEKDNKKIFQYELIGLNASHIKVNKQFVNKTKTLYVTVEGKYKDELTGFENEINIKLEVDYKIYNRVSTKIQDGILTITLYEIINDEPVVEIETI